MAISPFSSTSPPEASPGGPSMTARIRPILRKLEVDHPPGLSRVELMLQNDDLLPVPPEHRTWKWWNYLTFWLADSFNVNTWYITSSMIVGGLNWWQAWLAVWVGYGLSAVFLVLNGYGGAKYHITFPVMNRVSFGIFGSLWPVFNRAAMACIWYGVQAWIGGQCVYLLLQSIWPSIAHLHNGIPSSGTDTAHFLSFFLFCLLSLIPIWYPIHKVRHLFTLKAIVTPVAGVAFFVWFLVKAGGAGPILHKPATVKGSALGWAFIDAMMSCLSNMATLITNSLDFSSRADKPSSVVLPQLFALPFTFAIVSFFGIIVASSSNVIYGEEIWNPLDLLGRVLDDNPTHGSRAGVAFIAIAFIIAQVGTNVAANSVSAGCDLTALFPRFINVRRGGYVAAIVGFSMLPWRLLSSSNSFTTYLSAYSVFLSSIIGVMLSEYYLISHRRIKVQDLYKADKKAIYHYTLGINWRAYAAYICGILINVVGFAGAVGNDVPLAAKRIYELAFFTGCGVSFLIYTLLNHFFPVPAGKPTPEEAEESQTVWMMRRKREGGFDPEFEKDESDIGKVEGLDVRKRSRSNEMDGIGVDEDRKSLDKA